MKILGAGIRSVDTSLFERFLAGADRAPEALGGVGHFDMSPVGGRTITSGSSLERHYGRAGSSEAGSPH